VLNQGPEPKSINSLGQSPGLAKYKTNYVKSQVQSWVNAVEELAKIAANELHFANSCFTKGLSNK
jgi:hypothetical protein